LHKILNVSTPFNEYLPRCMKQDYLIATVILFIIYHLFFVERMKHNIIRCMQLIA